MSEVGVFERCRRSDGSIDWNRVAKLTHYAVSVEPLTPAVEQSIITPKLPETVAAHSITEA